MKIGKEGTNVIKNFGYLSILQLASYAFPLITMPYLARVIGTNGFGKIAFAIAVITWVKTVADWGFDYTATRDVAQNKENKEIVSRIFSDILWARCLLVVLSAIILKILIECFPYLQSNERIIWITFFLVPGHIFFPEWFFQALEKMKYTTLFNIIIKFIFTIAVFVLITDEDDYIYQPILTTVGYILSGCMSLFLILKKWGYRLYRPTIKGILHTIKNSTDVFINNLMPNLYNGFSIMLLGFYSGATHNGIFDGGNKFVNVFDKLQQVVTRTFFPFLSRRSDKHSLYVKINLGISICGALFLFIAAPYIVKLMLGPDFSESAIVIRILAVSLIFTSLNNAYGTNFLIIYHHERLMRNSAIIASVIGFLLAIPLVKFYSYIGTALVILISRGLLGTLSSVFALKIIRKSNL